MRGKAVVFVAVVAMVASSASAAFIVESAPGGLANANHTSTGGSISISSLALGCTPGSFSRFGGTAVDPAKDTYTYSFTPGTDADNVGAAQGFVNGAAIGDVRVDPTDLGVDPTPVYTLETQTSTGQSVHTAGQDIYNVYITWPNSSNVNSLGSIITVQNDLTNIVVDPVNQNLGGHGLGAGISGGNSAWLRIGSNVPLTAGTTYQVIVEANFNSFVSQRVHGVMWERVPEPTTLALLAFGGLLIRRRR